VIIYKIDILKVLKEKGYNTTCIRKNKILGEKTLTHIRKGEYISLKSIDIICGLLNCNIADLLEYIPEKTEDNKTDNKVNNND